MTARSNIFAAVRAAKPDIFNTYPSAISDLDELLDRYGVPRDGSRSISQAGIELIKQFEGCKLTAYQDTGGVWTIGVGHTKGVKPGQTITMAEADAFLRADLADAESAVRRLFPVTTQGQYDALVSFTFNLGEGQVSASTLRKKHNAEDYAGAAAQFGAWVYDNGVRLKGLERRREAEAKLYRGQA